MENTMLLYVSSLVLSLIGSFIVHPLPMIVYRYHIRKEPLPKSKAFLLALIDGAVVLLFWVVLSFLTGLAFNAIAWVLWCVVSFYVLSPINAPKITTKQLTTIAILAAISAILFMIEIPVVLFYKLDLSNLPVLLGTFAMGPVHGTLILLVKAMLGLLHSTSQGVGELADFIMGYAMLLPAGLIYQMGKSRKAANLGMLLGTVIATVAAILTNVYIMIPFYGAAYGMPVEAIVGMGSAIIPAIDGVWDFVLLITGPFNILKWVVISVVTALVYKPLSPILHGGRKRQRG